MTHYGLFAFANQDILAASVARRLLVTLLDVTTQCKLPESVTESSRTAANAEAKSSSQCEHGESKQEYARIPRNTLRYDIALTGGSDTLRMLEALSEDPLLPHIDWSSIHWWWADERFVHADDDQRNDLQAYKRLFDHLSTVTTSPLHIHPMPSLDPRDNNVSRETLEDAAKSYELELHHELGTTPTMDLLILGMGPDGHIASLFPDHESLCPTQNCVTYEVDSPKLPPLRLTMTMPMLARSRSTWMLTAGTAKREVLRHALQQSLQHSNDPSLPASYTTAREKCLWFTTLETL